MVIRLSARLISIVVLGLLAVLAWLLVLHATPEGLGLSDDSIAYVAGARSMLAGHGYREAWLASNGPVTHFPPAYPASLVALGWFGLDPLRGARLLGAVLFGLNSAVLGVLGWRMTKSLPAGIILAGLMVLNGSLLRVHASALSEPLFIFLTLLSFWVFDLYVERDHHWLWLVICGALVGLAYLTRYAGIALAGTLALALLGINSTWRKRMIGLAVFAAGLLPWVVGWTLRNAAVGGTVTNRILAWHPVPASNMEMAVHTAAELLVPAEPWREPLLRIPGLFTLMVVAILVAIAAWLAIAIFRDKAGLGLPRARILAFLNALYVLGYITSITASMFLFDASTKFRLRVLAPAYVSVLVLLVGMGAWAWSRSRRLVIGLGLGLLALSAFGQFTTVVELAKGGQGYASFRWYDSQAMAFLRGLPAATVVYSNEPGAVYLYTERPGYVLPDRIDPVTAETRPGFERGVTELQSEVLAGRAVLALFSGGDAPAKDLAALSAGLNLVHKSGGAEVYGAGP